MSENTPVEEQPVSEPVIKPLDLPRGSGFGEITKQRAEGDLVCTTQNVDTFLARVDPPIDHKPLIAEIQDLNKTTQNQSEKISALESYLELDIQRKRFLPGDFILMKGKNPVDAVALGNLRDQISGIVGGRVGLLMVTDDHSFGMDALTDKQKFEYTSYILNSPEKRSFPWLTDSASTKKLNKVTERFHCRFQRWLRLECFFRRLHLTFLAKIADRRVAWNGTLVGILEERLAVVHAVDMEIRRGKK